MTNSIPKGSTVLVTGINGFIGSHIADQILGAGYNVRGTSRTIEKSDSIKAVLEKRHCQGKLEIVAVPDMATAGAFDEAVKGVSGVAHVASNLSFSDDPNAVIPEVIAGIKSILDSAAKEPSVKRFVYTSSSTATASPKPNKKFTVTAHSWNQEDVDKAWNPNAENKAFAVYGASKTEAERALWKFVEETSPSFIANAVLPNANFGPKLEPSSGSTGDWPFAALKGDYSNVIGIPPQWFVDVRDTARLHLLALTEEDVQYERLFAYSSPYNWHDIFASAQKARPNQKLTKPPVNDDRDLSEVPGRLRSIELLKRLGRKDGFIGLDQSVKDAFDSV